MEGDKQAEKGSPVSYNVDFKRFDENGANEDSSLTRKKMFGKNCKAGTLTPTRAPTTSDDFDSLYESKNTVTRKNVRYLFVC